MIAAKAARSPRLANATRSASASASKSTVLRAVSTIMSPYAGIGLRTVDGAEAHDVGNRGKAEHQGFVPHSHGRRRVRLGDDDAPDHTGHLMGNAEVIVNSWDR